MANINLRNVAEEERNLVAAFGNLIAFGKLFLSGDFLKTKPTPIHHREMGTELLAPSNKPCVFILPRDSAKTTLTKARILHGICFASKAFEWGFIKDRDRLFYGWVSKSQRKSVQNVNYIKVNLEYNPNIIYYFGKLRGNTWNQEEVTTSNDCRLVSSSNTNSMRGDTMATIKEGAVRYSGVFCDDCFNEENTITQNSRDKVADNITNGILPAIDNTKPGRRLFYSGTPVHFDDLTQNLLDQWTTAVEEEGGSNPLLYTNDPEELAARDRAQKVFPWRVIAYKSTQPELPGGVLWEAYKSQEKLEEIKSRYKIRGELAGYYQEYELEVQHEEDALIGRKALKFHKGTYEHEQGVNYLTVDGIRKPVNIFGGVDPATDIKTKRSDYSVILYIAVDANNTVYVLHYERHRSIPTLGLRGTDGMIIDKKGVVDYIFELHQFYHAVHTAVEDVAMTRGVFQAVYAEQRRLNTSLSIKPYPPMVTVDKRDRIYSTLNWRFASGGIYLLENQYALIDEIVKFGSQMAHDDTLDALHIACANAYPCDLKVRAGTNEYHIQKPRVRNWKGVFNARVG